MGHDRDPACTFYCVHYRRLHGHRRLVIFSLKLAAAAGETRLDEVRAAAAVEHGHVGVRGGLRGRGARMTRVLFQRTPFCLCPHLSHQLRYMDILSARAP
jgi:hypothetical protein